MRARIHRTMLRTAVVLATLLTATNARAQEGNNPLYVLGLFVAIAAGMANVGFTLHDISAARRGEDPAIGVALAETGVGAAEVAAIWALSQALEPSDPMPLFAISLWPAALMVHGIWALTLDRPSVAETGSRSRSLEFAPAIAWTKDGTSLGVLGRF
jgi:hypothetical protein